MYPLCRAFAALKIEHTDKCFGRSNWSEIVATAVYLLISIRNNRKIKFTDSSGDFQLKSWGAQFRQKSEGRLEQIAVPRFRTPNCKWCIFLLLSGFVDHFAWITDFPNRFYCMASSPSSELCFPARSPRYFSTGS